MFFEKEWNKYKIPGRKRKQCNKCVLDIISDMDLTSPSLGSKEAVSCINNASLALPPLAKGRQHQTINNAFIGRNFIL